MDNSTDIVETTTYLVEVLTKRPTVPSYFIYYEQTAKKMFIYLCPVIVAFGLLGNVTSFLVMTSRDMRKQSTAVYLSALAISDSGVLLYIWTYNWLADMMIGKFFLSSDILCKLELIFRHVTFVFSGWSVLCVSAERLIVTAFPLRAHQLTGPRRARLVVVSVFIVAVGYSLAEVVPFGISATGPCNFKRYWQHVDGNNGKWTMMTLYSFIPTFLIFCNSTATAVMIRRQAKSSATMTASQNTQKTSAKATRLVLAVAFAYLTLTVPATIYLPLSRHLKVNGILAGLRRGPFSIAHRTCFLLILLNHSINFFLYVCVSCKFRNTLKRWAKCESRKDKATDPSSTAPSNTEHTKSRSLDDEPVQINTVLKTQL